MSYFYDIVNGSALPPHQVGVWIPKVKWDLRRTTFDHLGCQTHWIGSLMVVLLMLCIKRPIQCTHPRPLCRTSKSHRKQCLVSRKSLMVTTLQLLYLLICPRPLNESTLTGSLSYCASSVPLADCLRAPSFLFHRRVSHKVQGRLLPSRTIMQGVDMGRSFSVYLFCLAMDPLFTHLNRIPGVLSVQGYIDDTTIAGNAQCLEWLVDVSQCYSSLRTAGFVVDPHTCYRACVTTYNRSRPSTCLSDEVEDKWPGLISAEGYSTALVAMAAHSKPGYNTVVVRVGVANTQLDGMVAIGQRLCIAGILAYQQFLDIRDSHQMHQLGAFATIGCKCKSKSNILTNVPLRNSAIRKIEKSGFGVQTICGKAPSLGLALVGRYEFDVEGQFIQYVVPQGLDNHNAGPFRKLLDRLKSFSRPTLSITARCTGFNTFYPECYAVYYLLFWTNNFGSESIKTAGSKVYT